MKKILILGSNHLICDIVLKAKQMGIYTIVVDRNEISNAPAKKIADKHYEVCLSQTAKIVKIIKKEKIEGVITGFVDSYLPFYAEICEAANLPCYGTKEQFRILNDKKKYKELCRKFNVPTIDEYDEKSIFQEENKKEISYPVLVKPVDNSGARGVSVCNNFEELVAGYEKALLFSSSKKVLIEKYISGREITSFYLFVEGEIYLVGHGNRLIGIMQEGVIGLPAGYSFPSKNLPIYEEKIVDNIKKMLKSIGVKNGMMFMQNLVENDVCHVYDIGYRLTGSLEYILSEKVAGFNALEYLINFAMTGKMLTDNRDIEKLTAHWSHYCYNITIVARPGKIKKISGVKELSDIKGVVGVREGHIEGETIPETSKGTLDQVVLRLFCVVEKPNQIYQIVEKVEDIYQVYDDKNQNMILPIFEIKKEELYI